MTARHWGRGLMRVAADALDVAAGARPVLAPILPEHLDVHAAVNTYEVSDGAAPGVYRERDAASVVGSNGRRLIVLSLPEGVWIGGCLLTDLDDLRALAREINGFADDRTERAS